MSRMLRLFAPKPVAVKPQLLRETVPFVLEDGRRIDVLRVRDPRAKRLKLSVDERGARLTLPWRASLVSGERFLYEHRSWLTAQFAGFTQPGIEPPAPGVTAALDRRPGASRGSGRVRCVVRNPGPRQRRRERACAARLLRGAGAGRARPLDAPVPGRATAATCADRIQAHLFAMGLAGTGCDP